MVDHKQLTTQIEYYLSDKNLQNDQFFFDKIANETSGYVDLSIFLNCNNIKKLNASLEDIVLSIKSSKELALSEDQLKVKRIKNELPNFLGKKRKDKESKVEEKNGKEPNKHEHKIDYEGNEPTILLISNNKDKPIKWKELIKSLQANLPNHEVIYTRFGNQKGHAAVFEKATTDELKLDESVLSELTFMFDGIEFTVRPSNEEETSLFWKDHGSHYEFCLASKLNELKSKGKNIQSRDNTNILKHPVKLGTEVFAEVGKIKAKAREIFYNAEPGDCIDISNNGDKSFLIALFKYVDDSLDENYSVKIEKLNANRHHRSFVVYSTSGKKEPMSYLNACLKLSIANKKLKKEINKVEASI